MTWAAFGFSLNVTVTLTSNALETSTGRLGDRAHRDRLDVSKLR